MKTINGKAIYQPEGKAAEYAKYACNFYVGCSNGCTYCYLRKGVLAGTMGGDEPTLKKCFKNEAHALEVFEKELKANLPELREHGLFFSFTTDPLIEATEDLTIDAIVLCMKHGVYVNVLTKCVNEIDRFINRNFIRCGVWVTPENFKKYVAFGFSLTGHDELETNASTNAERIEAMRELHDTGFRTWASIEPVIDIESSSTMIRQTVDFCDLYKVGIERGKKYNPKDLLDFIRWTSGSNKPFYFKDSLLATADIRREDLPANCVTMDYNIFNDK